MKFKTGYNTCTIISSLKAADIDKAQRFCPEALVLMKDKTPVFKVKYDYFALNGCADPMGIVFNSETNDGYAFYTFTMETMPIDPDEIKTYIKNTYGMVLANLTTVEQQVMDNLSTINETMRGIEDSIEIAE